MALRHVLRTSLSAAAVLAITVLAAVAGAYVAMSIAAFFDRTEAGWFWVLVAAPVGLTIGATTGLYGSMWLLGRLGSDQ